MATKKFVCQVCGYVYEGESAPYQCPVCKEPGTQLKEVEQPGEPDKTAKKKRATNSNVYTLIYAAVMVIVVAFLLAFVNSSLRSRQDENIKMDTKKQILSALHVTGGKDANAE